MLYFTAHYRSFLDFNDDVLSQAKKQRYNIIKKLSEHDFTKIDANNYKELDSKLTSTKAKEFLAEVVSSVLDDLNTSKVIAAINKVLRDSDSEAISVLYRLDQKVLKLDLFDFSILSSSDEKNKIEVSQDIKDLATQRREAKQNKDRVTADKIRDELKVK